MGSKLSSLSKKKRHFFIYFSNLKIKIQLLFLFVLSATNSFSQDSTLINSRSLTLSFGSTERTEITISDLVSDSLQLISYSENSKKEHQDFKSERLELDGFSKNNLQVQSFNLTIQYKGTVLKYVENTPGNKLTHEMKEFVRKLHPGCRVVFDKIVLVDVTKNPGYGNIADGTSLRYILK